MNTGKTFSAVFYNKYLMQLQTTLRRESKNQRYWHVSRRLQNKSVSILKLVSPYGNNLHCKIYTVTSSLWRIYRLDLNLNHWQTLWAVDHTKSCIRAKHFRLSLQQIFKYNSKRRQVGRESSQWYWHVSQFLTKLDLSSLFLFLRQNQSSRSRKHKKRAAKQKRTVYYYGIQLQANTVDN